MVHSMTAFARQSREMPAGVVTWELRSVNHRYLDVAMRVPDELRVLETQLREVIGTYIKRGKVECRLRYEPATGAAARIALNDTLVDHLNHAMGEVKSRLHSAAAPIDVMDVLRWPGVIEGIEANIEQIQSTATTVLEEALKELTDTRAREGAKLQGFIEQRCDALLGYVDEARQLIPGISEQWRGRLLARLEEIKAELDESRLAQEMVYLAQKIDIEEELERLTAHIGEVRRVLQQNEPVGRRLDFLMQELNREANTLGSKSIDAGTTRLSIDMKVQIEQMREQIQNIE
jgi:uncharacterized protein (TIGR00255 family)